MMCQISTFKTHEILDEVIRRDTAEVATALHQSESIVRRWKEPPCLEEDFTQSSQRNPLDRLLIIYKTIHQIDHERADLLIRYICMISGYLPPIKIPELNVNSKKLLVEILKWTKEIGVTSSKIWNAIMDGRITREEIQLVTKEAMDEIEILLNLLSKLEGRGR